MYIRYTRNKYMINFQLLYIPNKMKIVTLINLYPQSFLSFKTNKILHEIFANRKEEFPANNERETIKKGVRVSEGGWTVKRCIKVEA